MSTLNQFGKRLRAVREQKKLSQKALVEAINTQLSLKLKRNTVSNYENAVSYPSMEVLKAIVNILDTSADFLLGIDVSSEPQKGPEQSLSERLGLAFNDLDRWHRNIHWLLLLREKFIGMDASSVKTYNN